MTPNVGLGDLVRELRAALETISGGLVDGRPERLLDAEPRLAGVIARLAALPPEDTTGHRAALLDAREALRRCEALGQTVTALDDVYAARQGYGPSGRAGGPGMNRPSSGVTGQLRARG
jgi:hypothetical protein